MLYSLQFCEELNEDVIFENACLSGSIGKNHDSKSVLNSSIPLSSINTAICPVHFSKSFFDIMLV